MGQEQYLMGVALERRSYAAPSQEGLHAWRSPSRGVVVQSRGSSPPSGGILSTAGSVDDWEEIEPPHLDHHSHREFCGAKFMDPGFSMARRSFIDKHPQVLTEGYVAVDIDGEDRWICDQCVDDFKGVFDWSLKDSTERA
jgi:hypothetical protein